MFQDQTKSGQERVPRLHASPLKIGIHFCFFFLMFPFFICFVNVNLPLAAGKVKWPRHAAFVYRGKETAQHNSHRKHISSVVVAVKSATIASAYSPVEADFVSGSFQNNVR
jgi:hypothetical protein